ncbi:MAG: prepilin-type N-terminal cleavage/methylation domain-containing protein [Endomicrobiia bacterium]
MRKTKGFTLVELVIVIVIVGILSIVAVPIYRGYTRKAMATEGKALLGAIQTAQKIYFAEFAFFASQTTATAFSSSLDVDARSNKYFTSFTITASAPNNAFTASTTGAATSGASGISLTLSASKTAAPVMTDAGLSD